MSASRPTGIYRVKLKTGEITVSEWQSQSECVVYFGSEEYGGEEDIAEWYEMIMTVKDWGHK